jgi:hypothetical protein
MAARLAYRLNAVWRLNFALIGGHAQLAPPSLHRRESVGMFVRGLTLKTLLVLLSIDLECCLAG